MIKRDLDMYEIEFSETFLSEDGQVLRAGGIVGGDPFVSLWCFIGMTLA